MPQSSERKRKIIQLLKRNGAADAATLAESLGVSAMAVRQHLYVLAEEGLVEASSSPDGIGRPSKRWHLTAAADSFFPQGYAELTAELLSSMQTVFGADGLDRIVAQRGTEQKQTYLAAIDGEETLHGRLEALSELRTKEGYMAEVQEDHDGFLFIENHCPICAAARACKGLCASELELFRSVLGDQAQVERTDHILAGARRCAYRVTPLA